MATAKLMTVRRDQTGMALEIEIFDTPHTYKVDIGITEAEILSVSTWNAFWTSILKPKLDAIIAKRKAMNTRIDAVEEKVGQTITI